MDVEKYLAELRASGVEFTEGPRMKLPESATAVKKIKFDATNIDIGVLMAALAGASEAEFQAVVIDLMHARDWRVAHFRKVRVQRGESTYWETPVAADGKGFLDLEAVRERLIKVECKKAGGRLEPEQELWLEAYRQAGIECHVWYPHDLPTILKVLE